MVRIERTMVSILWAREKIREKCCVAAFNADYAILPMLKKYFEKLDPDNEFTIKVDKHGVYEGFVLIPGAFKRGLPYLLPLAFTDATHLKPMGNRDTWHGMLYITSCIDGNSKSHIASIGHGKRESDRSWHFQLLSVFNRLVACFGLMFEFCLSIWHQISGTVAGTDCVCILYIVQVQKYNKLRLI